MIELIVPDMSCGHCVAAITHAIHELDADAAVHVRLAEKRVTVETDESRDFIAACLRDAGYRAEAADN